MTPQDDYELMMHNCMTYNRADTVYHKEAKRLLAVGCKHLTKVVPFNVAVFAVVAVAVVSVVAVDI